MTWFLPANEKARSHFSFSANACRKCALDVLQTQLQKLGDSVKVPFFVRFSNGIRNMFVNKDEQ